MTDRKPTEQEASASVRESWDEGDIQIIRRYYNKSRKYPRRSSDIRKVWEELIADLTKRGKRGLNRNKIHAAAKTHSIGSWGMNSAELEKKDREAINAVKARAGTFKTKNALLEAVRQKFPMNRFGSVRNVYGRIVHLGIEIPKVMANDDEGIDLKRSEYLAQEIRSYRRRGTFPIFVFTTAQNATPVHASFLAALKSYMEHRNARLYVIPIRYKNPTSHWSKTAQSYDWWAPEIEPYLLSTRVIINKNLMVLADIRTQPTASVPLSGFDAVSRDKSAIIGHTKIEMKTIATPQNKMPKILTTTGAVTKPNYTPTKAGKLGEFHHVSGAVIVEIMGGKFFLRQIYAESDGSFIDLNYRYSAYAPPQKVERAEALVLGDDHFEFMAKNVVKATYGAGGIVETLNPKYLVHHDGIDFHRRSHHSRADPIVMGAVYDKGYDKVENVLDEYAAFIDKYTPQDTINVFVPDNHSREHFMRWIKETDPRRDPANDTFWCKTYIAMREHAKYTNRGVEELNPFAYWMKRKLKTADRAVFLNVGESFIRRGVDMGFHGDKGSNGARGSLRTYSNIGVRTVIAHSHSPGIKGGSMQVGMSAEYNLTYEQGSPSGRLQAHGVLYENGKRSILIIVNDTWRAKVHKSPRRIGRKAKLKSHPA